jgi:hypothetical protein
MAGHGNDTSTSLTVVGGLTIDVHRRVVASFLSRELFSNRALHITSNATEGRGKGKKKKIKGGKKNRLVGRLEEPVNRES